MKPNDLPDARQLTRVWVARFDAYQDMVSNLVLPSGHENLLHAPLRGVTPKELARQILVGIETVVQMDIEKVGYAAA